MDLFASLDFPRFVLLTGVSVWLWIAVANNIIDRQTNVYLLGIMFSMKLLFEDENLGSGLKQRAVKESGFSARALSWVVAYQVCAAILLTAASLAMGARWLGLQDLGATGLANLAVASFVSLWFFFMCGGLWFGYWMKQSHVQQVHMNLVLFSMGIFALINLPG